ncbi:MAG: IS1380 family transposase [Woeseiaceae bacterium]
MRSSKAQILSRVHAVPTIRFTDETLTSASGLVLFQLLFERLDLKHRLRRGFRHLHQRGDFKLAELFLVLVVHILLGYRKLSDVAYYKDDPIVLRTLGLRRLPDDSTLSRRLRAVDLRAVEQQQVLNRELVLDRIVAGKLRRITLDFDGSVLSTRRHAEGTAVGFNRKRKGERSYYPLLCTVAQTGQFFDVLARSGNVHDSHGSLDFVEACVMAVHHRLPWVVIENRFDSAFFSENTVIRCEHLMTEYTISVPFERLPALKEIIESRSRWRRVDETWSYFEIVWQPKKWAKPSRFIFVRQKSVRRSQGPIQLDLFEPRSTEYSYKVIVSNKTAPAWDVIRFHHGRGSQEGLIGEGKSLAMMDYIPTRSWAGNQLYMQAAIMAHNLTRELQMQVQPCLRGDEPTRPARWFFEKLERIRNLIVRRAGRVHRPDGKLTLTMSANEAVRREFETYLEALSAA